MAPYTKRVIQKVAVSGRNIFVWRFTFYLKLTASFSIVYTICNISRFVWVQL